jgi:hypothetical protein
VPETPTNNCRASDDEVLALLKDISAKLTDMTSAFVLNDLHKPDFDGHRKAHLTMIKDAEIMDGYKRGITKKIIAWLAVGALGMLASGFIAQVSWHLK